MDQNIRKTHTEMYQELLLQQRRFEDVFANEVYKKIPERILFPKATGIYGTFKLTGDIKKYSKASIFNKIGSEYRVFVRFSSDFEFSFGQNLGLKGIAFKFYTPHGNWDLVATHLPVFFTKEIQKFNELLNVFRPNEKTMLYQDEVFWDFFSKNPESLHQLLYLFSHYGNPANYRYINAYPIHSYSLINQNKERTWVKFHLISEQNKTENSEISTQNFHQDLTNAIQNTNFPKWKLFIQTMTEVESQNFRWNPFDVTKIWPEDEFPLLEVGEIELNELPENYHEHTEQVAFSPVNLVEGISLSPDPLLLSRTNIYKQAQQHRLGRNFPYIEVNQCPFSSKKSNVEISLPTEVQAQEVFYSEYINARSFPNEDDFYTQPGQFYTEKLNVEERDYLVNQVVKQMKKITGSQANEIINRQLCHFFRANIELGMKIANGLGVSIDANVLEHTK